MERLFTLSTSDRLTAFREAEARLKLPAASIEKDFWVCWTLRVLFELPEWSSHLTFKGGTSLSKAWQLIERFSEDIDLVIDRDYLGFGGDHAPEKGPSKKQKKKRFDDLKHACQMAISESLQPALQNRFAEAIPADMQWRLLSDSDDNDAQTILFFYPTATETDPYIKPQVKIELGARSDTEPVESPEISPYLANAFPELFGPSRFQVRTVAARRTFWEKAMLLHEETYRPADKTRGQRLSRHYYDLWCLIRKGIADKAVADGNRLAPPGCWVPRSPGGSRRP
ncbi:nucleotidyl transferase AbiEii/AbiGii toxin family protein [Candidatus Thiodictyon syntrophicum]|jgi:hypothetical protein|uniref:Nucleotidyl transferase AbiEii/AbiGii toxin family protein n=1 Tax=Candidatus Thiodictyon syntrophicum TaxID=1166950 RepID=A0A2K8U4V8_9GAMM|nr:nucleotidyl transferase AbiEii/AbiGii toxin family protein [Candidatus Thiodictyon syntrophicum]AUB80618.1 hypothetical protein THSYN_06400 [Candidatus Thiodictyon syntrophicum]